MKKVSILLILPMLLLTAMSFGQTASRSQILTSDASKALASQKVADTLANATTKTQTAKIDGFNDMVSVQAVLTKISGTAAGKVYLLGSLDGTNFVRAGGSDSLTVLNVTTQSKIFEVTPSKYVHYRIQFVGGTGATQSVRFNSLAVYRKR
jgi:hypothetical protein